VNVRTVCVWGGGGGGRKDIGDVLREFYEVVFEFVNLVYLERFHTVRQ
jgi:hypothetical protein